MDINVFFEQPILNSPYPYPSGHWELDAAGQPAQRIIESCRRASYITPIPKPKKRNGRDQGQKEMVLDEGAGLSSIDQQYEITASQINAVRNEVDQWHLIPNPDNWHVTPEKARFADTGVIIISSLLDPSSLLGLASKVGQMPNGLKQSLRSRRQAQQTCLYGG